MSGVKHVDETTRSVMNDVNSDRRQLILQTVTRLLFRLQSVVDDTAQCENTLIKQTEDLTAYQVCPRNSVVAALLLFALLVLFCI